MYGLGTNQLAPALPAPLALVVPTVLPAQPASVESTAIQLILVKQLLPLLTMGLTVTFTASMEVKLVGLQALASALLATQGLKEQVVKIQHTMSTTWMVSSTQSAIMLTLALSLETPSWLTGIQRW